MYGEAVSGQGCNDLAEGVLCSEKVGEGGGACVSFTKSGKN